MKTIKTIKTCSLIPGTFIYFINGNVKIKAKVIQPGKDLAVIQVGKTLELAASHQITY